MSPELHVWLCRPDVHDDPLTVRRYESLLTDDERRRVEGHRTASGRRSALQARAFVRTILSRHAPVQPRDWRFVRGLRGRPEIAPGVTNLPLSFSLSHTTGLLALGVALDRRVGIDVECLARRVSPLSIAERYFSDEETAALLAVSPERQKELFLRLWTLKEAYLKARGIGLASSMGRCAFRLHDGGKVEPLFPAAEWQFAQLDPTNEHVLAVAVCPTARETVRIDLCWLSADD